MNIPYIIFTFLLLLFGITILVLSSIGLFNWNKLTVPDNVDCVNNFPDRIVKNLSVNKGSDNIYTESYESVRNKSFSIHLDIKSQSVPFIIGAQCSIDNNSWMNIDGSDTTSRVGVSSQSFNVNHPIKFIRLQIVSQGEGIEVNNITLKANISTQLSSKKKVRNIYILLIVLCCIIFVILGVTVWMTYKNKIPELIPETISKTEL